MGTICSTPRFRATPRRARASAWGFVAASLLLLSSSLAAQRGTRLPPQLRGFDGWVERARGDWGVPGLAVAVVKDDSVVYARGFGVRRLGDPAPVTDRTLFAVGSTTKAQQSTEVRAGAR